MEEGWGQRAFAWPLEELDWFAQVGKLMKRWILRPVQCTRHRGRGWGTGAVCPGVQPGTWGSVFGVVTCLVSGERATPAPGGTARQPHPRPAGERKSEGGPGAPGARALVGWWPRAVWAPLQAGLPWEGAQRWLSSLQGLGGPLFPQQHVLWHLRIPLTPSCLLPQTPLLSQEASEMSTLHR